jgi:hypothetical protein
MRQITRLTALVVTGLMVLPIFAADEKKDVDKKDVDKKAPELVKAGVLTGKVLSVDETKRTIRMRLELPELNQNTVQAIARDQAELQRVLLTERNPQTRAQRVAQLQVQIAQHQRNLYSVKHHDLDVNSSEEVKVRLKNPPVKFDDKGKIVRYTEKELKELKGDDPKLTGYNGEFADIRPNGYIEVHLMKKKGNPMIPKPQPGVKGKDVDAPDIQAILAEYSPQATMIVVIAEPPPG